MALQTDLTLPTPCGGIFNHRVGYLAFQNGAILLQESNERGFWFIPGGRIAFGENSKESLMREVYEELGLTVAAPDLAAVVENFFTETKPVHEVNFYYRIALPENFPLPTQEHNGDPISLAWHKLDELMELNLLPSFLKEHLPALQTGQHHFIRKD